MPEQFYTFLSDDGTFTSQAAAHMKTIYAPLCGSDSLGLKSAITPDLSGDIKVDKFHYVSKPASREDLRVPVRNFFVMVNGKGVYSLARDSQPDGGKVKVGQLWHHVTRTHKAAGIEISAEHFIPSTNETVELMQVTVTNISKKPVSITPTGAIPLFGRSLANKHDHEHVTALLNRITQVASGVELEPTMAFNEEGHKEIKSVYFVYGCEDSGVGPTGSFPTVDSFLGDGGDMLEPRAVLENHLPNRLPELERHGKEAFGALRFKDITLKPGKSKSYILAVGVAPSPQEAQQIFRKFNTPAKFEKAFNANTQFWSDKVSSITFKTADSHFDAWMRWVTLQPVLRRIFGCSFLPDHDYGKGGKGWRDLWQDLLSLILIEPHLVRESLINNCAGIRIDGSNATIIGSKPGEFIADRNAITRVWMDHGSWPFLTLLLYIHQTGDFDILLHRQTYFRDPQNSRSLEKDLAWVSTYGHKLLDKKHHVYEGTILEHLLVQNLVQFFNVGEHNIVRLESADWNDGLDMAFAKGESVAFAAFYAGNLLNLATLLEDMAQRKNMTTIRLAKELVLLLDTLSSEPVNYDHAHEKRSHLFGTYCSAVQPALSGEQVELNIADVAADLRKKGHWMFGHIRTQEQVTVETGGKKYRWFNGYYDNDSRRVEGKWGNTVRMTLTGQVFTVMSGLAHPDEVKGVISSVDKFLKDKKHGGYRLNTDFNVRHYLQLGRAFGFAYGTKENGAFFSHMNVMYGYALLSRGFIKEGLDVIHSIYRMANHPQHAKIYPGIPEYFDGEGRGMYHYLTGSASWLVLTMLTQVFGVRGHYGDLVLQPKLDKNVFDKHGKASVRLQFAGRSLHVEFNNPNKIDVVKYGIKDIQNGAKSLTYEKRPDGSCLIEREHLANVTSIKVLLDGA